MFALFWNLLLEFDIFVIDDVEEKGTDTDNSHTSVVSVW